MPRRCENAGVQVDAVRWPGTIHGFFRWLAATESRGRDRRGRRRAARARWPLAWRRARPGLDDARRRRAYRARHGRHHRHHRASGTRSPTWARSRQHELADRARRGRLGLRRRRQALPRRHREPLVREPRPRPRRRSPTRSPRRCARSRPTRPSATSATARRTSWPSGSPRTRRWTTRAIFLDLRRRRRDRHGGQDRAPPLVLQGQPERVHLISRTQRLPRHARLRHEHRRHRGQHRPTGARWSRRSRRSPYDSLEALEAEILRVGPDRVAAFFCEPVIGAGGVLPAARRLHRGRRRPVRRARDPARHRLGDLRLRPARHLVRDRALGGRAARHDHVRQGRHAPATCRSAASSVRRGRRAVLRRPGGPMLRHGATYAGHPTCCAAALAVLDIYEREDLIARGRELEGPLRDALAPLADHPAVGEVRGGPRPAGRRRASEDALAADPAAVAQARRRRARGRRAGAPAARRRRRLAAAVFEPEHLDELADGASAPGSTASAVSELGEGFPELRAGRRGSPRRWWPRSLRSCGAARRAARRP